MFQAKDSLINQYELNGMILRNQGEVTDAIWDPGLKILHLRCSRYFQKGAFPWENPKTDSWIQKRILRFFGEIQKQIMKPKYLHSRRILWIKSKSGFLRFTTSAFGQGFEKSIFDKGFSIQK